MTLKPKAQITLEADGSVVFKYSQSIEPIFDGVKAMSDLLPASHSGPAGSKYVGSIDDLTARNWAREWGVKMYTKEFNQLAAERIKSDSDYSKFRYRPN